ncbi:hypothetical protein [Candidatus Parabeggiatoa sp. HSG14]|uniref:hypothetical protein n=1 Tax=Candidatus Parabeggiatoa sp. HSG14 TaxID=3055593 RepID=UPI0025A8815F|nr:hypothetical protein [Thiotrichales bacterium HSG14]
MTKKPDKKTKKVYRFALYGLSASGKTCMLAALAMPRYPHPLGYSCTWQPIDVSASKNKAEAQHLEYSKEWMEKAIEKLSQQDVPEPNPTGEEQFIFQYDFTGENHQTFCIELVDYSGELINPAISNSELAKNLRTRFAEMDGILVLAEAPYQDQLGHVESSQKSRDGQTHMDLYQLRQAFSLLRGEKQDGAALDIPVALVVNKWDRYNAIEYNNPVNEQNNLENFLNATPQLPHKGLRDVLNSSITEGNFKAFPVSALGTSEFLRLENGDIVERAKQINPLKTFGLEDAFIWIAERRDAIDVQHYQNNATKNLKQCRQQGLEFLDRFPANSELAKQVEKTLWRCRKKGIYQWAATIVAIPVLWFMAETAMDTMNYRKHKVAINNPHVTHEQLEKAEQWLTKYVTAPVFRHVFSRIFLNQDKAQNLLTELAELQTHREKFLWEPVENALKENLMAAGIAASEYLKYYPYGTHAQEAQNIRLRAEIQKMQQENEDAFRHVAGRVQENSQNTDKLNELLEKLRNLPIYPQAETDEMRKKRMALEQKLSDKLVQIVSQQQWERFQKSYDNNMRRGNFLAAAKSLANRQADVRLNALKDSFKTVVIGELEKRAKQAVKDNRLQPARELLDQYAKFPHTLKTRKGNNQVKEWLSKIDEMEDEVLYEAVRKYRDIRHIHTYLQSAPLQTMKKEVEAYQNYLNKVDPTSTLKLQLQLTRITWTDNAEQDDDNVVTVYLNGKPIIQQSDIVSDSQNPTGVIGPSTKFSAKPSESITIEIKVVEEDLYFDDDNGQGTLKKLVSELANGYSLKLRNSDGVETGTAHLKLLGYPKAPPLPAWHGVR